MKASERISQIYGDLAAAVNAKLAEKGQPHLDDRSPEAAWLILRAVVEYLDEIPPSEGAK